MNSIARVAALRTRPTLSVAIVVAEGVYDLGGAPRICVAIGHDDYAGVALALGSQGA
ncbi:MAG: hypothetical protein ACI9K5_002928, partial [Gammaproteobacteria bacterium]